MNILRFSAIAVGLVILIFSAGGALLAGAFPQGEPFTPPWQMTLIILGAACIFVSGYLFVGYYGDRVRHSPRLRIIATLLLFIPIVATALLLLHSNHFEIYPVIIPLLIFSVALLVAIVWPFWQHRT